MKKAIFLFITIFLMTGFKGTVDQIDEKRMNKDLEIAKNILGTLIKTESGSFFGGESIKADYIKDYGVVFTIPEHLVYFHMEAPYPVEVPEIVIPDVQIAPMPEFNFEFNYEGMSDEDRDKIEKDMKKAQRDMEAAQEEMQKVQEQMNEAREEAMRAQQEAHEEAMVAHEEAMEAQIDAQLAQEEAYVRGQYTGLLPATSGSDINWEELMITFLADYADLIGQLKPEERIVLKQQMPGAEFGLYWEDDVEKPETTGIEAEVKRQDITAYKSGKISRDEFVKRVVIKKSEPQKKIADLEMFSSVLNRFFSRDLTESLVLQGKARYEKLDGFGVVYYISTEDPGRIGARSFYSPDNRFGRTTGEPSPGDDAAGLEKLYGEFKQDIKEFVLDYGRTIRSVGETEKVQLIVKLPPCVQCQLPKSLDVTVPMSLLNQYDQQKITKEKALAQVQLAEK